VEWSLQRNTEEDGCHEGLSKVWCVPIHTVAIAVGLSRGQNADMETDVSLEDKKVYHSQGIAPADKGTAQ
jgi:hypothetical protein